MKSLAKVSPLPRTARDSDIEDIRAELEYSITKNIENSKEIHDEAELSFEEALPLGILNLGHCPKPNSGIFTIPVFDVFDLEEGAHLDLEKGGILDLEEGVVDNVLQGNLPLIPSKHPLKKQRRLTTQSLTTII